MAELTELERQQKLLELTSAKRDEGDIGQDAAFLVENMQRNANQTSVWGGIKNAATKETLASRAMRVLSDETQGVKDRLYRNLGFREQNMADQANAFYTGVAGIGALLGFRENTPDYDKGEHVGRLLEGIPWQYHDDIMDNDNLAAAERQRERIMGELEYRGMADEQFKGGAWLGTIVDVDAPLILLSGGSMGAMKTAGKVASKMKAVGAGTKATTFASRTVAGMQTGAIEGLGFGVAYDAVSETNSWEDVLSFTLSGVAFGALTGPMIDPTTPRAKAARQVQEAAERAKTDLHEQVSMGDAYTRPSLVDVLQEPQEPSAWQMRNDALLEEQGNPEVLARQAKHREISADTVRGIMQSPDLKEVEDLLYANGFSRLKNLSAGREKAVLYQGDQVVRIMPAADAPTYANHPRILKPIYAQTVGDLYVEVMSRVEVDTPAGLHKQMSGELRAGGFIWGDPHPGNMGRDASGEWMILDGPVVPRDIVDAAKQRSNTQPGVVHLSQEFPEELRYMPPEFPNPAIQSSGIYTDPIDIDDVPPAGVLPPSGPVLIIKE